METALKIQMDLKNNNEDLQNFMLDLNNWEDEMKTKEAALSNESAVDKNIPPPRNKIKRSKPENGKNSAKPKKISAYDYSAWDKFDADRACAELDEENDGESEEVPQSVEENIIDDKHDIVDANDKNLSLIDQAFYEKEMGNQFVKKEKWNDAIKCYSNAITMDSKNPIYYANRSLCFLKLKNFKSAEVDATVAIQLDKNYVKAYQRRAIARLALGQLLEGKTDFEEVLKIEPKNALARIEIEKINKTLNKDSKTSKVLSNKPVFNAKDIFKSNENKPKMTNVTNSSNQNSVSTNKVSESIPKIKEIQAKSMPTNTIAKKEECVVNREKNFYSEGDGDKPASILLSKPTVNIFKPLPECCSIVHPVKVPPHKRSKKPLKRIVIKEVEEDSKDLEAEEILLCPSNPNLMERTVADVKEKPEPETKAFTFDVPKTSIQFQNQWKILKKNPEEAYLYLKKIPATKLPQIFENSLESEFFSELLRFLASDEVNIEPELIYSFLLGLSKVKRFSSMILFLSTKDRLCLKKSISEISKIKPEEEISNLNKLYEL